MCFAVFVSFYRRKWQTFSSSRRVAFCSVCMLNFWLLQTDELGFKFGSPNWTHFPLLSHQPKSKFFFRKTWLLGSRLRNCFQESTPVSSAPSIICFDTFVNEKHSGFSGNWLNCHKFQLVPHNDIRTWPVPHYCVSAVWSDWCGWCGSTVIDAGWAAKQRTGGLFEDQQVFFSICLGDFGSVCWLIVFLTCQEDKVWRNLPRRVCFSQRHLRKVFRLNYMKDRDHQTRASLISW